MPIKKLEMGDRSPLRVVVVRAQLVIQPKGTESVFRYAASKREGGQALFPSSEHIESLQANLEPTKCWAANIAITSALPYVRR